MKCTFIFLLVPGRKVFHFGLSSQAEMCCLMDTPLSLESRLLNGKRLLCPKLDDVRLLALFDLVLLCWQFQCGSRPDWQSIVRTLSRIQSMPVRGEGTPEVQRRSSSSPHCVKSHGPTLLVQPKSTRVHTELCSKGRGAVPLLQSRNCSWRLLENECCKT